MSETEHADVPDPIRPILHDTYWDRQAFIHAQLQFAYEVKLDCEFVFGLESVTWSHEERCRRLAEFYNGIWHDKGGIGDHPYNHKYKETTC